MARDESGASAVVASVASALAVLAVLAVLASATVAGVSFRAAGDDTTAGPTGGSTAPSPSATEPEEERLFPDGQLLAGDRRDNATLEIPSVDEGWTYQSGTVLGYETDDGGETVAVTDPYVLDEGFCTTKQGRDETRAFVGFSAPITDVTGDDPARQGAEAIVERWVPVLFENDPEPRVDYVDTEISDGTPAVTATVQVDVDAPNRCGAPTEELTFLAFDTGDFVATVVLGRAVDTDGGDLDGGLGADEAEEIVLSARALTED